MKKKATRLSLPIDPNTFLIAIFNLYARYAAGFSYIPLQKATSKKEAAKKSFHKQHQNPAAFFPLKITVFS
ncbi:MAG: hypothetical protein K2K57_09050 [Oscillospiraceae bacterium]|nr:hypothetical protein [Oscillospiraceae bacterium]